MSFLCVLLIFSLSYLSPEAVKITRKTPSVKGKGLKHVRRFEIPKHFSPADMPTLNDAGVEAIRINKPTTNAIHDTELPGAYGEESDFDEENASGSGSSGDSPVKKSTTRKPSARHHPHKPETASRFGNNWHLQPGINPSAAFVTKQLNHKGFKGHDKDIQDEKSKKDSKPKKRQTVHKKHQSKKQVKSQLSQTEDKELKSYLKKVNKEYKEKDEKENEVDDNDEEGSSSDDNSIQSEDADIIKQIKNIAEEIDKVEKKRKEKEKEKNKSKNATSNSTASQISDVLYPHANAVAKGVDGFQCPWSCFWTCQSYCPRECCNNPYNCSGACREICTPYCKDVCCAPGAKRLPKLKIPLLPAKSTESNAKNKEIMFKLKELKAASDYAVKLLGVQASSCPAFCNRICMPPMCQPSCCEKRTITNAGVSLENHQQQLLTSSVVQQPHSNIQNSFSRRENFLKNYPTIPQEDGMYNIQTNPIGSPIVTKATTNIAAQAARRQSMNEPSVFCATPQNCPPGGIVNSNYCPPICRSSCIEQCPNECCMRHST